MRANGNTDGRADVQCRGANGETLRQFDDDPLGGAGQLFAIGVGAPHDRELIATNPADLPVLPGRFPQTASDLDQKLVADRVAERIIDQLEPIEIDQQQRASTIVSPLA